MARGKALISFGGFFIKRWLGVCICVGLLGCTPLPAATSVASTPCPPALAGSNIYTTTPDPHTASIFQYAATSTPDPFYTYSPDVLASIQQQRIREARYAALKLLEYEAKRWTHTQDFRDDAGSEVHISVTFLSPELLQAVFQNAILAHSPATVDVYATMNNFISQITKREEHIFFVAIWSNGPSTTFSPRHIVDLDARNMILTNADDHQIAPKHFDHHLDQPNDLSEGPVFGYIYYPFSVIEGGLCEQVLDYQSNTKINIETPALLFDTVSKGPYIWTIFFAPLVNTGNTFYTPEYPPANTSVDDTVLVPSNALPTDPNDANYWRDFARFIWGQVTLENY